MNLRAPDERAALGDCFDGLSEKVDTGIKKKKKKEREEKNAIPGLCRHFYYTKTPHRCGRDVTQNEIRSFCVHFIIIIIFCFFVFYICASDDIHCALPLPALLLALISMR